MSKAWMKYKAFLVLVCLCLCVVLGVGVAYGRYQLEFPRRSYIFSPTVPDNIFLCGSVEGDWLNHGNLPALEQEWQPNGTGVKLDFGVTNGNAEHISQREQSYVIRLAAGLSVEDPEKLLVTLYWWDAVGDIHWVNATPAPIREGSMLNASYGDGWVYEFRADGEEISFSLPGGSLAYSNYTIAVSGEVEPALLNLQVLGQEGE